MTSPSSYDKVAKTLHWLIALAILLMLALGWIMGGLDGTQKFQAFQLHKSIGITILFLSIIRLIWRCTHRFPTLPASMGLLEKFAAKFVHVAFYCIIIGMPLTGWVIISASTRNIPTLLYGYIPWPLLPIIPTLDNKKELGHLFGEIHGLLAYATAFLIVLHIGAAIKHHKINRDDVLLRMLPQCISQHLRTPQSPVA